MMSTSNNEWIPVHQISHSKIYRAKLWQIRFNHQRNQSQSGEFVLRIWWIKQIEISKVDIPGGPGLRTTCQCRICGFDPWARRILHLHVATTPVWHSQWFLFLHVHNEKPAHHNWRRSPAAANWESCMQQWPSGFKQKKKKRKTWR